MTPSPSTARSHLPPPPAHHSSGVKELGWGQRVARPEKLAAVGSLFMGIWGKFEAIVVMGVGRHLRNSMQPDAGSRARTDARRAGNQSRLASAYGWRVRVPIIPVSIHHNCRWLSRRIHPRFRTVVSIPDPRPPEYENGGNPVWTGLASAAFSYRSSDGFQ